MVDRVIGVFRLDSNTFEDVEHDSSAMSQAVIIVALVALLSALGSGFSASFLGGTFGGQFISTLIWTFASWIIWAVITYLVGSVLFKGQADVGEMLRVLGFAQAPRLLGIIPCIGGIVGAIWALIAGFIAVRQGLDLDNTKAFFTIVIGWLVVVLGSFLVNALVGGVASLADSI